MTNRLGSRFRGNDERGQKGLSQFLDAAQQQAWLDGAALEDGERPEQSLELRFHYAARFEKLLRRPEAGAVLHLLRRYAADCLPIPRLTERFYWSVSCLPSSPDRPLVRVNASWMELFALHPDGKDDVKARFILHLADFTSDGSVDQERLDQDLLEQGVERPEEVSHQFWGKNDILVVKVRGAASIGKFLSASHGLKAIRRFNLAYLNRGRNAYQASHCYSLADTMLGD
jgi:hypothetical protein